MLKGTFDVVFSDIISNIEGTLARSGITFFTDICAGLFILLIFIQPFCSADSKVTVLKGSVDFFFFETRQVNVNLISRVR